jgi:hypothetical protein
MRRKKPNDEPTGAGLFNNGKDANNRTQSTMDGILNQQHWLALNGLDATAEVLAITDTGILIDMDPVVILTLKVQPAMIAAEFKITGKTMVSRMAVPRVGDKLKLKYNPANPTQFIVMLL